tara:strand:+ start:615 stop:914 length:300 start_codon:yes stop_codon:yes gene_type:complete
MRGVDSRDIAKMLRDVEVRKIDLQRETPRLINLGMPLKSKNKTSIFKGVKNRGYDKKDLVKTSREKLQHNKANSSFQLTPFSPDFKSLSGSSYIKPHIN